MKRQKEMYGAEGETRTRMGLLPLDPEARRWVFGNWLNFYNYLNFKEFAIIRNIKMIAKYTQYTKKMSQEIWVEIRLG